MTEDDDLREADDGERYRVGSKALDAAALSFARTVSVRLADIVAQLTSGPPLCLRVLESGTVRTELFAEDAMAVAALLLPVAGAAAEGPVLPESEGVTLPGGEFEYPMHPTFYAIRAGVDYKPGLAAALTARRVLRDVLRACLPRGPLAMVPTANVHGRGIVRLDLTPADAERLVVLLCYVGERMERGRRGRRS